MKPLTPDEVAAKSAELTINQIGLVKQIQLINEEFGMEITRRQLERYRKREVYQRVVRDYTETLIKSSVSELRRGMSNLVPKIIAAIEKALDEGNIQAIPHALKILGVENVEPVQQAQSLTVVMPGAKPKEIEVSNDQTDSESNGSESN